MGSQEEPRMKVEKFRWETCMRPRDGVLRKSLRERIGENGKNTLMYPYPYFFIALRESGRSYVLLLLRDVK